MQQRWQDVSIPISSQMTTWPGDPEFSLAPACSIADGASCNVSQVTMCTHTGTHCDAPWHFVQEGATLDKMDTSLFFGKALVIEVPNVELITEAHLPDKLLAKRVLFKTKNSVIPTDGPFESSFAALQLDAAQKLVSLGVKLVGIDYLSISPYGNSTPVHRVLLEAGILVIEGLRLAAIAPGLYEFVVLPLPLVDADGAPCRAFIYA